MSHTEAAETSTLVLFSQIERSLSTLVTQPSSHVLLADKQTTKLTGVGSGGSTLEQGVCSCYSYKYLGHIVNSGLTDDPDIMKGFEPATEYNE